MTDKQKMVEISEERLKDLEDSEAMLLALEAQGVDNWPGYSNAIESLENEEDED